jgi:hypothetical protein
MGNGKWEMGNGEKRTLEDKVDKEKSIQNPKSKMV